MKNNGVLIPYRGVKDLNYPEKLAREIKKIYKNRGMLKRGKLGVKIAKERYEYEKLSEKLQAILAS